MNKTIIFDIDGTLLNSVDLHTLAWQDALGHFGHDLPYDRVRGQMGKGGDQLLPALLPEDVVNEQGEEMQEYRAGLFKRDYLARVRPFPSVRELFRKIKAEGGRIVLASSARADELELYKKIAEVVDLVDSATCADDAERSKPHPDIFHAALDRTPASEAIAIGDTPYDAQAATTAGIRTIGVLCGGFPEADLRESGCVAIFRDPADLLARFVEWFHINEHSV